ncbi:uncharacterized protein METZ01_LOCUS390270, partial [marine metagenome]
IVISHCLIATPHFVKLIFYENIY